MWYTGVGSRETPAGVLDTMADLAEWLATRGYCLRSGGAPGADTAFEVGHRRVHASDLEIYLPWQGFNDSSSKLVGVTEDALAMAAAAHPAWGACGQAARLLHGRNVYQVLGQSLASPSAFLVCWTPDGCVDERRSRATGGTGTAIYLASKAGVPVFNLQRPGTERALRDFVAGRPLLLGQGSLGF